MTNNSLTVGVIGGGLLGMTLSLRLAQAGLNVAIIESSEKTGGVAGSCSIGGYVWDRFYHVVLKSDSQLLSLLGELGLKNQINWRMTKTGYYTQGQLYSISNLFEYLRFRPLNMLDKLRLGWTIFYGSRIRDGRKLENTTSANWLIKHSGRNTFHKFWLPLLQSKLGPEYERANASFIWAHISRLYAARRTGLKTEMFGYFSGGTQKVIDTLHSHLEKQGVKVHCNMTAQRVTVDASGVRVETSGGRTLAFDHVVLTVPSTQIPRICPQLSIGEKRRLEKVVHQDLLCAALILKKSLSKFYITNIADLSVPFTGVIEMTAVVDRTNFDGHSLVYLPKYLSKDDVFSQKSAREILGLFFNHLQRMHPHIVSDDLVASCISKVVDFPTIPTLHYSQEALPHSQTTLKNITLVNSAQILNGTHNINEIVGLANRKSHELVVYLRNASY